MRGSRILAFFPALLLCWSMCWGESGPGNDPWYANPLGFSPLELHARNGFLLPALAVGICLFLTTEDQATGEVRYFNESGFGQSYNYPYTTLIMNNSGVELFLRNWMSVGADAGLYYPSDAFNNTLGISIRPFARFYPVNNDRWRCYFESGVGLIYFADRFPQPTDQDPRLGTNSNFTSRYGLGGEINLARSTSLLFGVRHIHVSNGNLKGAERNPSHDSNGVFLGFSYCPVK